MSQDEEVHVHASWTCRSLIWLPFSPWSWNCSSSHDRPQAITRSVVTCRNIHVGAFKVYLTLWAIPGPTRERLPIRGKIPKRVLKG